MEAEYIVLNQVMCDVIPFMFPMKEISFIFRCDTAQDVPSNIIIWYMAKTIPIFLEYDQFVV